MTSELVLKVFSMPVIFRDRLEIFIFWLNDSEFNIIDNNFSISTWDMAEKFKEESILNLNIQSISKLTKLKHVI